MCTKPEPMDAYRWAPGKAYVRLAEVKRVMDYEANRIEELQDLDEDERFEIIVSRLDKMSDEVQELMDSLEPQSGAEFVY